MIERIAQQCKHPNAIITPISRLGVREGSGESERHRERGGERERGERERYKGA